MENSICDKCKRKIDENERGYIAHDLQKGYEKKVFCSKECRDSWIAYKKTTMWITVILGAIIAIAMCREDGSAAGLMLLFLPYMIRQAAHGLKDIFNGGTVGEIFSFIVVLLGTITVIYPAYKLYQEIKQYSDIKNADAMNQHHAKEKRGEKNDF